MANTLNNIKDAPGIIAKAAAQTLKDNLVFCNNIAKADASDFDGKNGYKAGDTIYTSIPARFTPQTTFDITSSLQDVTEQKAALTLDTISTVGMEIDSFEFATEMELKDTIRRAVMPAAEAIAQDVERRFLEKATDATYNSVGTAGSNAFAVADVLAGRTRLNQNLCPAAERSFLLNSESGAKAVDARKGLFQDSSKIADQYLNGMVGRADGFDWYENELINVHENGNDVVFEVRTTVSTQGQSTLVVEGLTADTGTVKKGTVFTVATVKAVHPQTKQVYSHLQQFTVTADATADSNGYATLSISPAMYTTGTLQNISEFPTDGDAITPVGAASTSYAQNLMFHKSAFKMVSVPLIMPTKAEVAAQETVDGITVAVVRDFDVLKRRMITRLDFLGGLSAVRPEWACRVTA